MQALVRVKIFSMVPLQLKVVDGPQVDVLDLEHCSALVRVKIYSIAVVDGPRVDVNPTAALPLSLLSPILIQNVLGD